MEKESLIYETELEYESAMEEIYHLMEKGEGNLTSSEVSKLRQMALAAEAFEDLHFPLPKLKSVPS